MNANVCFTNTGTKFERPLSMISRCVFCDFCGLEVGDVADYVRGTCYYSCGASFAAGMHFGARGPEV